MTSVTPLHHLVKFDYLGFNRVKMQDEWKAYCICGKWEAVGNKSWVCLARDTHLANL